ncbi:MAG: HAD family hydrolase [Candidatus Cloacimonadaceae bacterium]|nr:HAD family hydrolase [Candidatus Cloacimonadaceae bacterium]
MTAKDIKKAVFLDRDGCLSPDDYGYISDPAGYSLYPYTPEALAILKKKGYLLFLVTNQSGIARGYFGIEELNKVHDKLQQLLGEHDLALDKIYFSPYFETGSVKPYNVRHEDRKPGLGMFLRAKDEFGFETRASWMIGDRYSDIAFGKKAGLTTILLMSGNGIKEMTNNMQDWEYKPDFIAENLIAAARLIELLDYEKP